MSLLNQKTIASIIKFKGIGLHTGQESEMTIHPSEPNSGIVFKRVDLKKNNFIFPGVYNVSSANFCTTISNEFGVRISTVEHLMAALMVMNVDNALIEVNGNELPILDGSSKLFIEKIKSIGLKGSNKPIKIIKINKEVSFTEGEKFIKISPNKISLEIDFEIKYENKFIGIQRNKVNVYEDDLDEVLSSRTFCLLEDVEKLNKMNLGLGGSLDNALVVDGEKLINPEGLRNKLEFVNHKILDCIGDLYLSGYKIIGKVLCSQGGHKLTNQILRKLFANKDNYSIFEIEEKNLPSTLIFKKLLKSIA